MVRKSRKESSKDEALKKASALRPDLSVSVPGAASRVEMNAPTKSVGAPWTPPRHAPEHVCLDKADAVIDALLAPSRAPHPYRRGRARPTLFGLALSSCHSAILCATRTAKRGRRASPPTRWTRQRSRSPPRRDSSMPSYRIFL